jgi:hypothetical protein
MARVPEGNCANEVAERAVWQARAGEVTAGLCTGAVIVMQSVQQKAAVEDSRFEGH